MHAITRDILTQRGFSLQADGSFAKGAPAVVSIDKSAVGVPKPKRKQGKSPLAAKFEEAWQAASGPLLTPEHKFHPKRKWRFDYAHLRAKIAIELDGGIFSNGRHNRASGFLKDCEKLNAAAAEGFRVFRLATGMVTPENIAPIITAIRSALFTP